jgi:hypothetical protein
VGSGEGRDEQRRSIREEDRRRRRGRRSAGALRRTGRGDPKGRPGARSRRGPAQDGRGRTGQGQARDLRQGQLRLSRQARLDRLPVRAPARPDRRGAGRHPPAGARAPLRARRHPRPARRAPVPLRGRRVRPCRAGEAGGRAQGHHRAARGQPEQDRGDLRDRGRAARRRARGGALGRGAAAARGRGAGLSGAQAGPRGQGAARSAGGRATGSRATGSLGTGSLGTGRRGRKSRRSRPGRRSPRSM